MADLTVSFELYNEETVRILKEEDPDLLPDYSVNSNKDLAYNKKQVTSAITSGIIKGESIPKIASNLQSTIKSLNQSSAVSAARTAAIAAQNTGSLSSMKRLAEMGIEVQKEWVATLDVRTRPSHRALDGQRRNLDEAFSNGLQYPGASGNPAERWNCRCKIKAYMPKYDSEDEPRLTYSEWKSNKKLADNTNSKGNDKSYSTEKQLSNSKVINCKDFDELANYFHDNYNIDIEDAVKKLDFESVLDGLTGVDYILKEFPQAAGSLVKIYSSSGGFMSTNPAGKIGFNSLYYNDRQDLINRISAASNIGYYVKNASAQTIGSHEAGHILELALIQKSVKSGKYSDADFAWDHCSEANRIVTAAYNSLFSKAMRGEITTFSSKNGFISQISEYAKVDDSECMAECIHDCFANGDNANILSKEVWQILKGELG